MINGIIYLVNGFCSKKYCIKAAFFRSPTKKARSINPSQLFTFRQSALDIFALLEHLDINSWNVHSFVSVQFIFQLQASYN